MKKVWAVGVMVLFLFGISPLVKGQGKEFPARPIEMVVPFPPGGTADICARIVLDQLSKELKASVVVINKAGASGTIGTSGVAKGNPDGHLLLTGNPACFIIPYFFFKKRPL